MTLCLSLTIWGEIGAQDDICSSCGVERLDARSQLAPVPNAGGPVPTAADHQVLLSRLNLSMQEAPSIICKPSYTCFARAGSAAAWPCRKHSSRAGVQGVSHACMPWCKEEGLRTCSVLILRSWRLMLVPLLGSLASTTSTSPSLSPSSMELPSVVQSNAENSESSRTASSSNSPCAGSMRRTMPSYAAVYKFPDAHLNQNKHSRLNWPVQPF